MKIAILGFAREGRSTLTFLRKSKEYRNAELWVLDAKKGVPVPHGVKSILGKRYLAGIEQFDLVFRTPGVPYYLPALKRARTQGVVFSSQTKLFFDEMARRGSSRVIGVTGTKGKGTTSTLIYAILKAAGKKTYLAGNIGAPALELLPKLDKKSWVVLELSSFQLQDLDRSPHIAVVLDVFPDHQDSHRGLKEYYEAKASIARHQKRSDLIFFFKHSARSRWIAKQSRGGKTAVDERAFDWFAPGDLKLKGGHNFKNAVMAATVAARLGVSRAVILKTIQTFPGLAHRLEFVRGVKNVSFWNDSASTNPHTAAAAVRAFPAEPTVLIAGGQDKNLNYQPLAEALRGSTTRLVVLLGENKKKIARAIRSSGVPLKLARDLKTALAVASHVAQSLSPKSCHLKAHVILSPGAASFDMFKNYADRGDQFKKRVKTL